MVKNLPDNARDTGDMGWENFLGEEMATHSYSCLGNPMDRGAWQARVHGVEKSWT